MNQEKIGAFIAQLRKEKGLTQNRLAENMGISEKTISKWECGKGLPEVSYMVNLCDILGITVNELLSGERIPFIDMMKKMEETFISFVRQIEEEQLKNRIYKQYGLNVCDIKSSEFGAGSLTYIICDEKNKKYVVKYPAENGMNNIDEEPAICDYLSRKGIPVSKFVLNVQGNAISIDENGRKYHVQKYIEGRTYEYHTAPHWLITKSAEMLGRIHGAFKEYPRLHDGIGEDFFRFRTIENTLTSLRNSLERALAQCNDSIVYEIRSNMEVLERFPKYSFDLSKFTVSNTHGDYMISQLLCGDNQINGVIDWTSSCVHPVVWEVIRSYVYMSPKCAEGVIDIDEFKDYVRTYIKYYRLNKYDLENMGKMFFYFTAVCDFYGQYFDALTPNRDIFLKQALLSSKLLRWFDLHITELTDNMISIAEEMNIN